MSRIAQLDVMEQTFRSSLESHINELRGWVRDWPGLVRQIQDDVGGKELSFQDTNLTLNTLEDLQRALSSASEDLGNYADDVDAILNAVESLVAE